VADNDMPFINKPLNVGICLVGAQGHTTMG
jgi:hypothetical protein